MILLTSLLRPIYGTNLEIGTVDGMQGREKEAVVISLVRSNDTVCLFFFHSLPLFLTCPIDAQREVGFLKEKRRLNGMKIPFKLTIGNI